MEDLIVGGIGLASINNGEKQTITNTIMILPFLIKNV